MSGQRFYAVRQARTRVIGSRVMSEAEAGREVAAWLENVGPAAVVPATPELARAVRSYDQAALAPLLAPVHTVTVTYRRKRWYLAFSKLPDHAPFGPYDLPEAIGQLRVAALLEHIDARTLVLDAAAAEDHTATAPTG
jgi:hypothetical protein